LFTITTSSPQVNQEIYSEEDLLAIDSSPHEVIDQLAVETVSDAQGALLLPPPAFQPTGKRQAMIFILKLYSSCRNKISKDCSQSVRK
jgi:hypothetical protein